MRGTQPGFLNRRAELARLAALLRAGKSALLYGPAGIGKSALLAELRRRRAPRDQLLLNTAAPLEPGPWLRQVLLALAIQEEAPAPLLRARLGVKPKAGAAEVRAVLGQRTARAARALLLEILSQTPCAVALDPTGFLSRTFYELLRDLERATRTPLLLVALSVHMEDIGFATKFAWPREQRLALEGLGAEEMAMLYEQGVSGWERRPANEEVFRAHVLDTAAGNPGKLLGLLRLAGQESYWAGDSLKFHLLTVDFALHGACASGKAK